MEYLRSGRLAPADRRRRRQVVVSFAAAVALSAYVGLRVSRHLTPGYVSNLQHNLHLLEIGCAAGVVVAGAILVVHRIRNGIGHRLADRDVVCWIAGAATIALSVYAYKFRRAAVPRRRSRRRR